MRKGNSDNQVVFEVDRATEVATQLHRPSEYERRRICGFYDSPNDEGRSGRNAAPILMSVAKGNEKLERDILRASEYAEKTGCNLEAGYSAVTGGLLLTRHLQIKGQLVEKAGASEDRFMSCGLSDGDEGASGSGRSETRSTTSWMNNPLNL